jgi:hypothetical protein
MEPARRSLWATPREAAQPKEMTMKTNRKAKLVPLGKVSRVTRASIQGDQPELTAPFLSRSVG